MSKVKILYLEASEADADSIGSLVNIVREVQSGRETPAITSASVKTFVEPSEPKALPAARKPRKPRAVKAASADVAKSDRAPRAGEQIMAAVRKNPRVDRIKLASQVYAGDPRGINKVGQMLNYFVKQGKLTNNHDGTFTVNG